MRIKKVEIENFRSTRNSSLTFSGSTALLGENNCGKSTFLSAIDLFFASSPRVKDRDFSDRNTGSPINITIHFSELTPYDLSEFQENLLGGELVITRRFSTDSDESGKYFVSAKVNPDFSECRNESGKTAKRDLYKPLREKYNLPKEKSADEIDGFLSEWEAANPDDLKIEKISAFKGWTNVAAGKLKQKTNYVLIKAVQDAAEDIQQSKSSQVKVLIDTIARQAIENGEAFKAFISNANKTMAELTDPKKAPILADISGGLTGILSEYYKDSEILATWNPITQIQPSFPTAEIEVKNNSFTTGLDGVGHGLQRAIILTVLRYMADHHAKAEGGGQVFSEAQSDLIIAIEEPEIYQHPTKQRLFGKLLRKLSDGFNEVTGIRVQTIFVTHSPLLVSIGACENIRLVRLINEADGKNVSVKDISLARCAARSASVAGVKPEDAWSPSLYAAKLHTFHSELAEGFFSKCVVLVEGVGDKSILEAWYHLSDRDPHAEGVVIAQVGGKQNLDKPVVIFEEMGVPCYWVFDNDKTAKKKDADQSKKINRILQLLAGVEAEKCDDWPEGRYANYTAWDTRLEKYVADKVGKELFDKTSASLSEKFEIDNDVCLKFPSSAAEMLKIFLESGIEFPELDEILNHIDKKLG